MIPRLRTQWTSRPHFEQLSDEVLELPFEVGLHIQELQPKHLRVDHERIGASVAHADRLVDEIVGLVGLLGNDVDGVFENLALSACHGAGRLERSADLLGLLTSFTSRGATR